MTHHKESTNVRFYERCLPPALRILARLDPARAAQLLNRLFMTPRRVRPPERERAWAAAAEPVVEELEGVVAHGLHWGRRGAPLVLLVHGWAGRAGQLGAFAGPLEAAGWQVLALDAPAHGASPGRRFSLEEYRRFLLAVLRRWQPQALIAHSFGAAATTLALAGTGTAPVLAYLAPAWDIDRYLPALVRRLGLGERIAELCRRRLEHEFGVDWERLRPARAVRHLDAPLLLVHDLEDEEVPPAESSAYARAWPGARRLTTHGLGHRRILRDPAVVAEVVEFLTAAPGLPDALDPGPAGLRDPAARPGRSRGWRKRMGIEPTPPVADDARLRF